MARLKAVNWLLNKASSGELRDVDPGFSDKFYGLWASAMESVLRFARATQEAGGAPTPEPPAPLPPPSDSA